MFLQYQLQLKVPMHPAKYLEIFWCLNYLLKALLCAHFFPNWTIVPLPKRYSANVNFAICKVLHNFKDKRNVLPDSNAILGKHQPFIWAVELLHSHSHLDSLIDFDFSAVPPTCRQTTAESNHICNTAAVSCCYSATSTISVIEQFQRYTAAGCGPLTFCPKMVKRQMLAA